MSHYYRYKQCMDDARTLAQEAEELMSKRGALRSSEQQLRCASLLEKAKLLRILAMKYAFGTPASQESRRKAKRSTVEDNGLAVFHHDAGS